MQKTLHRIVEFPDTWKNRVSEHPDDPQCPRVWAILFDFFISAALSPYNPFLVAPLELQKHRRTYGVFAPRKGLEGNLVTLTMDGSGSRQRLSILTKGKRTDCFVS